MENKEQKQGKKEGSENNKIYLTYSEGRNTKIKFITYNFGKYRQGDSKMVFNNKKEVIEYFKENGFEYDTEIREEMFFEFRGKTYGFKVKEMKI